MAHPTLAASDPVYWFSLLVLAGGVAMVVWLARNGIPRRITTALGVIGLFILSLPAGCYALLGTACYVGGNCP